MEQHQHQKTSCTCLPSNYVTITQLQERWLKQQNENNREKHQTNETPQNHDDSGTSRRDIEVVVEDHPKLEGGAGIGDITGESSKEKKKNTRKWKSKRKAKVEKKGESEESEKTETKIESELNEKKNGDSKTVEKVEQKVRVSSVNFGNDKRNGRFQPQRKYYGDRGYGYGNGNGGNRQHSKVSIRRSEKMVWVRKDSGGSVGFDEN